MVDTDNKFEINLDDFNDVFQFYFRDCAKPLIKALMPVRDEPGFIIMPYNNETMQIVNTLDFIEGGSVCFTIKGKRQGMQYAPKFWEKHFQIIEKERSGQSNSYRQRSAYFMHAILKMLPPSHPLSTDKVIIIDINGVNWIGDRYSKAEKYWDRVPYVTYEEIKKYCKKDEY